jgi:hypothetical protein
MANKITGQGPPRHFIDYPLIEHRADYEPARNHLLKRSTEIAGLLGLYEYGSVGAPGISDIDLIAVIDSTINKQEAIEFLSGTDAPAQVTRVLDQGTIKPMSESLFSRINVLGNITTTPIYAPNPITPSTPDQNHIKFIDIANVIDWLPERVLMLRSLLNQPTLSCRRVLGGLGSFKHSASTVNRVLGYEPEESTRFANTYDTLRSNWFESNDDNFEKTVDLIKIGIATGQSLLLKVTNHLVDVGILESNEAASGTTFWLNSSKAFIFDSQEASTDLATDTSQPLTHIISPAWVPILTKYAASDGKISSLIAANTDLPQGYSYPEIQNDFGVILNQRIEWINESFEFLSPLGLSEHMYRFSHLRPRAN